MPWPVLRSGAIRWLQRSPRASPDRGPCPPQGSKDRDSLPSADVARRGDVSIDPCSMNPKRLKRYRWSALNCQHSGSQEERTAGHRGSCSA